MDLEYFWICTVLNISGTDAVQCPCHKCKKCNSEKETKRLVSPDTDKLQLWAMPQRKLQNVIQPLDYEVLPLPPTNISQQLPENEIINCIYGAISHECCSRIALILPEDTWSIFTPNFSPVMCPSWQAGRICICSQMTWLRKELNLSKVKRLNKEPIITI